MLEETYYSDGKDDFKISVNSVAKGCSLRARVLNYR